MITANNVTKSFGGPPALNGCDIHVNTGSVYGLVGANGAGKTTLLKLLAGILRADAGEVCVDGAPVFENNETKARLFFLPDDLSYFSRFTLAETARFFSRIYTRWDAPLFARIVSGLGLDTKAPLARFSKGMQKQGVFAIAFATKPDVLLLDEPIDGLDPLVRRAVWDMILEGVSDRGMTTLVSSHNLREMEGYCDHVGIINHGYMMMEKDMDEMKNGVYKLQVSFGGRGFIERDAEADRDRAPEEAYAKLRIIHRERRGAVDLLIVRQSREELEGWNEEFRPILFDPLPLTLEEIFLYELGEIDHEQIDLF